MAIHTNWLLVVACAALSGCYVEAATIDFDNRTVGTVYGENGPNFEGEEVLFENGIGMSVQRFNFGSFTDFFEAAVIGPNPVAFPSNSLALNQINVAFDFSRLGFVPNSVTLDFRSLGGSNNFSVNGGPTFELATLDDIPANPSVGVIATVSNNQIILSGDIDRILVGGQETIVDNLIVVPEPASLLLLAMASCALIRRRMTSHL